MKWKELIIQTNIKIGELALESPDGFSLPSIMGRIKLVLKELPRSYIKNLIDYRHYNLYKEKIIPSPFINGEYIFPKLTIKPHPYSIHMKAWRAVPLIRMVEIARKVAKADPFKYDVINAYNK